MFGFPFVAGESLVEIIKVEKCVAGEETISRDFIRLDGLETRLIVLSNIVTGRHQVRYKLCIRFLRARN